MKLSPMLLLVFATSACFPRGLGFFGAVAATAIVTAAIVELATAAAAGSSSSPSPAPATPTSPATGRARAR